VQEPEHSGGPEQIAVFQFFSFPVDARCKSGDEFDARTWVP
jgi:hypothetical protein